MHTSMSMSKFSASEIQSQLLGQSDGLNRESGLGRSCGMLVIVELHEHCIVPIVWVRAWPWQRTLEGTIVFIASPPATLLFWSTAAPILAIVPLHSKQ